MWECVLKIAITKQDLLLFLLAILHRSVIDVADDKRQQKLDFWPEKKINKNKAENNLSLHLSAPEIATFGATRNFD